MCLEGNALGEINERMTNTLFCLYMNLKKEKQNNSKKQKNTSSQRQNRETVATEVRIGKSTKGANL